MLDKHSESVYLFEENSKLREKIEVLRNQHGQILVFADYCSTLLTVTDIEIATQQIIEKMGKLVDGEYIKFVRKEPETDMYAYYHYRRGCIEKKILHRNELSTSCFFMYCKKIHVGNEKTPFVAVPIKYEGENIGAILFENLRADLLHTVNLKLLELFALPTGLVIKNCILLAQSMKEKQIISQQNQQLNEDLTFAQKIQGSILPEGNHSFKDYTFYGEHKQAYYLGGDFFDYFEVDSRHIVFYIADVSGHGVGASLLTVFLKQVVRDLASPFKGRMPSPTEILLKLQKSFERLNVSSELYIGILIGVLDVEKHVITISNAGHNVEPMYLNFFGDEITTYELHGLPINNWFMDSSSVNYEEKKVFLNKGDRFILLTDGAVEAQSMDRENFGIEAIQELLIEGKNNCGKECFQHLIKKIVAHTGTEKLKDDIAFLMLERQG